MASQSGARYRLSALLAGVTLMTSCSPDSSGIRRLPLEPGAAAAVITLSPTSTSLGYIGETRQFAAQLGDGTGTTAAGARFTWTSANSGVVSVSSSGIVTAVTEGTTQITVRTVNVVDTATVIVKRIAATVALSVDDILFTELATSETVTATILDGGGQSLPSSTIVWSSADTAVATVSSSGVVTSVGQGATTVKGTADAVQASLSVRVATGPASIDVSPASVALSALGDTLTVGGTVLDAAGAALSGVVVTFEWGDTTIADVDEATGLITATGLGFTTVTVVGDTVRQNISVTVTQTPVSVVVAPESTTLTPGGAVTFSATVEDSNQNTIENFSISWSTTDVAVATVTSSGLATAVAAGTALIVGTAGPVADSVLVTVLDVMVDSVEVTPDSLALDTEENGTLAATFFSDQGIELIGPSAIWASTDTDVATVTSAGVVLGVGDGTAWIRGTADNGADSAHVTVTAVSFFNIDLRYVGAEPAAEVQAAFTAAELRWEEILIGDLPDVFMTFAESACGIAHPAVNEIVDDVLIYAEVTAIDGSGGTLGQAGPCFVRVAGGLSIVGTMQFDEDDLADLLASGDLSNVVIHEMGHVLGLGGSTPWNDTRVGTTDTTGDPYWPGTEAVAQYDLNGGTATNKVPVANTGGSGTADAHWREADMGRELMTGYINSGQVNPLSSITIGAMQDMGYTVDLTKGDSYTVSATLRAAPDRLIQLRELPMPPPLKIDSRGRVVR